MATQRQQLLATQSHWQARNRVRFNGGQGLQESSELVPNATWNQDLRARARPASRDRGVSTGPQEAGHRQSAQVTSGQSDARGSLEGRQSDLGFEDLQKQANCRNGEGEGVHQGRTGGEHRGRTGGEH